MSEVPAFLTTIEESASSVKFLLNPQTGRCLLIDKNLLAMRCQELGLRTTLHIVVVNKPWEDYVGRWEGSEERVILNVWLIASCHTIPPAIDLLEKQVLRTLLHEVRHAWQDQVGGLRWCRPLLYSCIAFGFTAACWGYLFGAYVTAVTSHGVHVTWANHFAGLFGGIVAFLTGLAVVCKVFDRWLYHLQTHERDADEFARKHFRDPVWQGIITISNS